MNAGDKFKPTANLGDILPMDRGQQAAATHFICCLYGDNKCKTLNELKCEKTDKGIAAKKRPPTEDSFAIHLLRCAHQVYIRKHAHSGHHVILPTRYGYENRGWAIEVKNDDRK